MTPIERRNIQRQIINYHSTQISDDEGNNDFYWDYLRELNDEDLLKELNWYFYLNCSEEEEQTVINNIVNQGNIHKAEEYCEKINLFHQKIDGKLVVNLNGKVNTFSF